MRSLDIGCGFLRDSHRKRGETGIDLRKGFCDVVADAEHLPFRDQVFERVLMYAVLQHLDHSTKCLAEAKRVGEPGAKYEITIPSGAAKRIYLKKILLEFPFSLISTTRLLWRLTKNKYRGFSVKSNITPSLIEDFLSIDKIENRAHPHPWFCGRKGKILTKIMGRCVYSKFGSLYIEARKK